MPSQRLNIQPTLAAQQAAQPKNPNLSPNAITAPPPGYSGAVTDYLNQKAMMSVPANAAPPDIPADMLRPDGSYADVTDLFPMPGQVAAQQPPAPPAAPPVATAQAEPEPPKKPGRPSKAAQKSKLDIKAEADVDNNAKIVDSQRDGLILQPSQPPIPIPPSTREAYIAEHKPFNPDSFPDVADIFRGRVPNEIPITGVINPAAPAPVPQAVRVEHVITHELPSTAKAYVVTKGFHAYLGDVFQGFEQGQIIYDVSIIDTLIKGGCANIRPHEAVNTFIVCPSCKHSFPQAAAERLQ